MEFKGLGELIARFAISSPDKVAIERGNENITYQELEEKSNKIANFLRETGETVGNIPLIFENSIQLVEAILGVIKAGGIFAPLDPYYPANRIDLMLKEIEADWIITQGEWLEKLDNMLEGQDKILNVILLDSLKEEEIKEGKFKNLKIHPLEEILKREGTPVNIINKNCYIYFTSGSTGKPKGILGRHTSLVHFIDWEIKEFGVMKDFRVSQLTTPSFDAILRDIFVPLCVGGTLCIPETKEIVMTPKALANWLEEEKITLVHMVPTLFKAMMAEIDDSKLFKELKYILLAGELLRGNDIKKFIQLFGGQTQLVNLYGATETTLVKFFYRIKEEDIEKSVIPVGRPIHGAQVLLLDDKLQNCGVEEVGEIYIRTPFISSGYYNNKELTREVFIKNPLGNNPKDIVYKTGDTGRLLPTGELEVMGRIDHQVKIRGIRIELGEIENRLIQYPNIKEAVVVAREVEGGGKALWGYITSDNPPKMEDLKEYLGKELPEYMIPTYMIQLEELPLTPNGKVDRKSLPILEGMMMVSTEYTAPVNDTERILVEIWQEILGVERISTKDDFFKIGGHSLKATSMTAKIHKVFNVEVPLTLIFKSPTIKEIAQYIEGREVSIYSDIQPVEEKPYYPVSSAQKRIYMLQQMEEGGVGYHIPGAFIMKGAIDQQRLEKVFKGLVDRHESLRTSFKVVDGEIVQVIHKDVDFKIEYFEATGDELKGLLDSFVKPFQLEVAPLLRVGLIKIDHEEYMMFFDIHHIVSDGTSMTILIREFAQLYQEINPEPLKIQYKDFSQWQKELFDSGKIEEQKKYWLQQFEGDIPVLNLNGDYPRPAIQSFEGDRLSFQLEEDLTNSLREICKMTGSTMYMLLLATFNVLLSKYTGQEDIVVGSPIAGRPHDDLKNILGMFVNTLAMRNLPQGEKTFQGFLGEVRKNALGAYEHQDYQFEELVLNLDIARDMSRNPLFDVMFTMHNMDMRALEIEGLTIEPYDFVNTISKFDMTLSAMEMEKNINIAIEYSTRLFKQETIERLFNHFRNILLQISRGLEIKISEIDLTTVEEKQLMLKKFNNTRVDYPREKTIHQLFEEQVERTPEALAVTFGVESITYQQLNERANQVARILMEKGVKTDTLVGIMVERSLEMLVGLMGILKSGGAYLPIDPEYPQERVKYMMEDSGAKILLTQSWLMDRISFEGEMISLDEPQIYETVEAQGVVTTNGNSTNNNADALAYVIYTSGSTGKPKGVMINHQSAVNFIHGMTEKIKFFDGDSILSLTTLSFDIFFLETILPLVKGLRVVVANKDQQINPSELMALIKKEKIHMLQATPSRLKMILNASQGWSSFEGIKRILLGGEALPPTLLKELKTQTRAEIFNMYGPTETTIWSTIKNLTYIKEVTIGKPIANTQVYIVDQSNRLQPIGIAGELCIGGDGLARGYLNRPELTEEKFVPNPFVAGEKMYRTGDLARWLSNGNIEFLGRLDHQVKIRGYRIELGEIEDQLAKYPSVKEAVVIAKANKDGSKYLASYITGDGEIDVADIKKYLSKDLPEYMIPSFILQLEKMPLTPNGKIDRKAMPEPDGSMLSGVEYEPPRNETDQVIVEIWQEILGIEKIGINDNFFDIGGNSINIIKVATEIEKRLEVKFSIGNLYLNNTIKEIADNVYKDSILNDLECVVKLNKSNSDRNIFILHGYDGDIFYYRNLAKLLEKDYVVYGIQSKGYVKDVKLPESVEEMLGNYISEIKMIQPEGPYIIGGFCVGVMLSYELTRMLEDEGHKVDKLLLFDGKAFIADAPLKWINRKEKLENGGFVKQLANQSLEKYMDRVQRNMAKGEYTGGREFQQLIRTDGGGSVVDKAVIKKNIGTIVYTKFLVRRKIHTPLGIFKAKENNDPLINKEKWETMVNAPVDFYETPGDHESMLLEPDVKCLAELVRETLK